MTPRLRKFALTAHVTSSVGWLGAVVAFLALAVIGLTSQDARAVRGAYLVMEPAAWFVLVPLAFASLLTGLVMSLGTTWGVFRHYWVLFKLVITAFATLILLIYMGTFRYMARVAADPSVDLHKVRNPTPTLHAVLAEYPGNAVLGQVTALDNAVFAAARLGAGVTAGAPDPLARVFLRFLSTPVSLPVAAAELGVTPAELLPMLPGEPRLAPLREAAGTLDRLLWEAAYADVLCALSHRPWHNVPAENCEWR